MKITVDEAREYFAHVSQQKASMITPDKLPENGVVYYAQGGVCLMFNDAHWPGVAMVHCAVNQDAHGAAVEPARAIIAEFIDDYQPQAIIAWLDEKNRAAIAYSRRVGFQDCGRFELPSGGVIQQEFQAWA